MALFSEIGDLVLWRMAGVMYGLLYIIDVYYFFFPMFLFWIISDFLVRILSSKGTTILCSNLHSKPFYIFVINWREKVLNRRNICDIPRISKWPGKLPNADMSFLNIHQSQLHGVLLPRRPRASVYIKYSSMEGPLLSAQKCVSSRFSHSSSDSCPVISSLQQTMARLLT